MEPPIKIGVIEPSPAPSPLGNYVRWVRRSRGLDQRAGGVNGRRSAPDRGRQVDPRKPPAPQKLIVRDGVPVLMARGAAR